MGNDIADISISVAQTTSEKKAAYRLRYDVFTTELGDERYSNHEAKEFRDTDDVETSLIFVGKFGGETVGTCRLKLLRHQEFIALDQYHIGVLAKHLDCDIEALSKGLAAIDRAAVAKSWRGTGLIKAMFNALETEAISLGARTLIGSVEQSEPALTVFYRRVLGYNAYAATGEHLGLKCQCLYKLLSDGP